MIAVLFAISVIVFLIFNVIPNSDPAARIAGKNADPALIARVSADLGLDQAIARAVPDDDEADLHRPADVVCEGSQRRRADLGRAARDVLVVHRRGDPVDVAGDPVRLPERCACRQVHRPRADNPFAGGYFDAGVLAGGDAALLLHLQGRAVPDGQLRAAHREPAGVGLSPDPALVSRWRCCSSVSTAGCCAPTCST